tara:strand:+ start:3632 stop:4309 length:678 start_codon:yes stop_codon:yes gene_type:complete
MKVNLKLPTLETITIGQFQEISKHYELNGESYSADQYMVSVIYGMPLKDVRAIQKSVLDKIIDEVKKVLAQEPELVTRFTIGETEYGFVPNLQELSAGEYADIETYLGSVDDFNKAMAVMYRPIKEEWKTKYTIQPYNGTGERANTMRNAPLSTFRSAMVFFWNLEKELLNALMDFTVRETEKLATFHRKDSTQKSGGGILPSTELLEEYSRILTEQRSQMFSRS